MEKLTRWLRRQAAREGRAVYLEDALLGGRFGAYARYRLRFFFVRALTAAAVHALKFVLLLSVFTGNEFELVVIAQAAAGLIGGFWWGALESMRARVRDLYRSGRPHVIEREVGAWIATSGRIALGVVGVAGLWAVVRTAASGFGPAEAFVLAIALRVSLGLVTRCYHSGVYAIRRVFRPLEAVVAVEVASFALTLAAWPWLGAWAFPLGAVLGAGVAAVLTVVFTARTYRFLGIAPGRHIRRTRDLRGAHREALTAGASHAAMTLDSLLVLSLLGGAAASGQGVSLAYLLFILAPTIRAGFEWAHLFYFDLKRMEVRPFGTLRRRFEADVSRLSWLVAAIFWVVSAGIAAAVTGRLPWFLLFLLGPFFFVRSLLAVLQVRSFADGRYGPVVVSGAVAAAGFLVAGLLPNDILRLVAVIAAAGLAIVPLPLASQRVRPRGRVLALPEWVSAASSSPGPVRVGAARLWREPEADGEVDESRWRDTRIAEALGRQLGSRGDVALMHPDMLVWVERDPEPRTREWLIREGGGLVASISVTDAHPAGVEALRDASRLGILGVAVADGTVGTAEALRAEFERTFPRGIVLAAGEPPPAALAHLPPAEKRVLLSAAIAYATDLRSHPRRSRFEVTAFCPGGDLRLIFVVDRRESGRSRARWRDTLRRVNLAPADPTGARAEIS